MKKSIRILILSSAVVLLVFQFLPKHNDNLSDAGGRYGIESVHHVPDDVMAQLKKSCYDCHSNHTTYPWYAQVQPVSMWLNHHVEEGREELNFSEFGNYSIRKQYHKLDEIREQVEDQEMPLSSYTLIHGDAKMDDAGKTMLAGWARHLRDSFRLVYPSDSLSRKRRA